MGADDEAGDDATRQNGVVIFKLHCTLPVACVGGFAIEEVGEEVAGGGVVEGEAEFNFLEEVEEEGVFVGRVAFCIVEDGGELVAF